MLKIFKKISLFIIGILFLPFTLTYLIIKNKKRSRIKKLLLIFLVWLIFLTVVPSSSTNPKQNKPRISPAPTKTVKKSILTVTPTPTPTSTPTPTFTSTPNVSLIKVIDGDTIEVNINGINEKVRLIGLDTPEMSDSRESIRCFAVEAKNKTQSLIAYQNIKLEKDPTQNNRDKYNRLLRYVILKDGRNLAKVIIEQGYGYEYTYRIPYVYQKEFKEAQKKAEKNKVGLWNPNHPCNLSTPSPTINNSSDIGNNSSSTFTCGTKRYCSQMLSCEEAYFYLRNCGLSRLDGDKDGVPCESLCH